MKTERWAVVAALMIAAAPAWASQSMPVKNVEDFIGQFRHVIDDGHGKASWAGEIYHGALAASSTPNDPVYPALAKALEGVNAAAAGLDAPAAKVEALGDRFTALSKGKDEISSDQPEWKEAQGIIDQLKAQQDPLQDAAQVLSKALQQFSQVANKGGVSQLDIGGMRTQFKNYTEKMPGWLEQGAALSDQAKAKAADPAAGPERRKQLQDLVGKFDPLLAEIKADWPGYKALATKALVTPAGNDIHYYQGPGVTQAPILAELHESSQKIHQKVERFKELRDKLK
jgi:ABC-type transporter Mla subunit MlaD